MKKGDKIIITLSTKEPFEAVYLEDSENSNLVRIRIDDECYSRYGFVNKKLIKL